MKLTLNIRPNGDIEGIYSDALFPRLMAHGESEVTRASHVEPGRDRQGNPCWYVDLSPVGGLEKIGPFFRRQEALDFEVEYLKANVIFGG